MERERERERRAKEGEVSDKIKETEGRRDGQRGETSKRKVRGGKREIIKEMKGRGWRNR